MKDSEDDVYGAMWPILHAVTFKYILLYASFMNVIIVHGCPDSEERVLDPAKRTFDKHWLPWLKRELEARGIAAQSPLMPRPWQPVYEDYKDVFDKLLVNEASVLIGHSCGCAFLVRWLGQTRKKIAKLMLVAPWKIPDEVGDVKKAFYEYPIDSFVSERVARIIYFTADDEDDDGKESLRLFHDVLGGEIISLEGHGHYCLGDMGTEEFPELLERVLE